MGKTGRLLSMAAVFLWLYMKAGLSPSVFALNVQPSHEGCCGARPVFLAGRPHYAVRLYSPLTPVHEKESCLAPVQVSQVDPRHHRFRRVHPPQRQDARLGKGREAGPSARKGSRSGFRAGRPSPARSSQVRRTEASTRTEADRNQRGGGDVS